MLSILLCFMVLVPGFAAENSNTQSLLKKSITDPEALAEQEQSQRFFFDDYEKCDWLVKYRGQLYNLSPLTRKAINRPLENDLRAVLNRVDSAAIHLKQMQTETKKSRGYSAIATFSLITLAIVRIGTSMDTNQKVFDSDSEQILSIASLAFFLTGTFQSWRATRRSREELALAISSFNAYSPHKITPAERKNYATP